jgi:hypothetical protein
MRKYIGIIILVGFVCYSCTTCEDVKRYCMSLSCSLKVTKKFRDRGINFIGYDKNNHEVEFSDFEHWDIYDYAEIGDSVVKELGKPEIKLVKKDTTMVFPLVCHGRAIY